VLKPQVQISGDRSSIYITVPIEEGEQFFVGKISYSGDLELKDEVGNVLVRPSDVGDRVTLHQGEVFNRSKLFADLQHAADLYRDQGYAYANVTPNTAVNADKRTVDVGLEVEKGEKVYFDKIEISGNTKTRDKVIRRELRIYEGELFSSTAMEISKMRVTALGYFETVNITTERGSAPNKMNVKVEIKEKSTGTFQVGAGFSSVEKFIATAQVSQQNFLGRGESVALQAQLSFGDYGRQILTFNFVEPYLADTLWSLNFNAYATQQLFKDFQRQRTGGSLGFGYPLNKSGSIRAFLTYTGEYVQSGNFNNVFNINTSNTATRNIAGLNIKGFVSSVRADIQYDTRDNRIFATKGNFDLVSVEVADKAIGAAYDFVRLSGNLRYYHPLPLGSVFKVNTQIGYISSRDPEGVPISERYFLGGIYSIRGFYPREIGPSQRVPNSGGDPSSPSSIFVYGGDKQLQVNAELEFPIIQQAGIRGVIFCDFGNAWNDDENFFYIGRKSSLIPDVYALGSNKPMKPPLGMVYSVGFGVRWFSPIGPLRFETGIPLTKIEPSDNDLVFEFTIGNFF
jgi:outer membrane protein insertion porin family